MTGLYRIRAGGKISEMTPASQTCPAPALAARYEALPRLSQILTAHREPKELFRVLGSELRRVAQFDYMKLVLCGEGAKETHSSVLEVLNRPLTIPVPEFAPEETTTWWVYQNQQPLVIPFVEKETRFPRLMEFLKERGIKSVASFPLKTMDRRLGGFMFGSERADVFSEEEVEFLSLVANQVALAIDDAFSFENSEFAKAELQRERDRLKLVLDLNNSLVSNLDLQELLRVISADVQRVMRCESAGVALVDSNRNHLRLYALDFPDGKGILRERDMITLENSPYAGIWQTGKPVVLHGDLAQKDPLAGAEGLHSLCLIPLISRRRTLGILGLGRLQHEPFTQDDVDFLSQVAAQVAIAVENALAYGEIIELKNKLTQEKLYLEDEIRRELNLDEIVGESGALRQASRYVTLFRVSQILAAYREPKELFRVLASELRQVVPFDYMKVVLCGEAVKKTSRSLLEVLGRPLTVPVPKFTPEETTIWWVYQNQQPLVIPFVEKETRFPRVMEFLRENGIKSMTSLPLTTVHRRLGGFVIGSEHADAFSAEEVEFLSLVANQIAVAIDDALNWEASGLAQRELERKQDELERERDRLKLLLNINNNVILNLELRELLGSISVSMRRVMQCDAVAVYLPDSDDNRLRLYALDFPEGKGFLHEEILVSIQDTGPGRVFRTGEPLVGPLGPHAASHEHCNAVIDEGFKFACLLPLISRNHVLGVLGLGRLQDNTFTQDDVDFLMQVAGQAAIAMDNAFAYGQIAELKDKLAQEKLYLENEIRSELNFDEIVGESGALRQALQQVETVAPTDSTVLILGETGTGKELVARAIHSHSRRSNRAFVRLNCAAIPTGLLESELFGHERGAFTGAIAQKIGRLELADQGTLFLDEVGDIPLELQPKLLRALQEREFERLGSSKTKKVDVRLVAATNRDLSKMVAEQQFRSDLYYRLNVFPIRIPPLRERSEDIPLLVRHFTQKYARRMEKRIETIPATAMNRLRGWHWPGNVRELENFIERAVILTRSSALNVPVSELSEGPSGMNGPVVSASSEREHIERVLRDTDGRVGGPKGAAARLGLKRTTLISRMKKLGINPAEVS
jgi:formate hydrogenlyase transcriptional activator